MFDGRAVDTVFWLMQAGDVFCCYGWGGHIGTTSMKINHEVWGKSTLREHEDNRRSFTMSNSVFTRVAVDAGG